MKLRVKELQWENVYSKLPEAHPFSYDGVQELVYPFYSISPLAELGSELQMPTLVYADAKGCIVTRNLSTGYVMMSVAKIICQEHFEAFIRSNIITK